MAEITFRLFGYDFDCVIQKLERVPIFYRDPSEPFGEGWYKRSGNQSWTGQPIRTQMIELGYPKDWYADELVITVEYDADGFRNPPNMRDWFLVVVGDSFTELGNLPQSALFTTILSQHLGKPVRNLGVSRTGTYTQIAYLRKFGKAPSTRHAVCVFFEGNDPVDVVNELKILHKIREGEIKHDDLLASYEPQTSLTVALVRTPWEVSAMRKIRQEILAYADGNTIWTRPDGVEVGLTIDYAPPNSARLGPVAVQLTEAVKEWAVACSELELQPWLLYMPCKRRVLKVAGQKFVTKNPKIGPWYPTDLPDFIQQLCRQHGVTFLNATDDLADSTRGGQLPFNTICDPHLNRHGSRIIAELLCRQFDIDRQEIPH